MDHLKDAASIYSELSRESLDLVKKLNRQHKNTFSIPTRFISSDNVQLAYLLSEYYNYGREAKQKKIFRSFYVNSRYEAFQGAIKLIRNHGILKKRTTIFVLDPEYSLQFLANPVNEQREDNFLIPGLNFVKNVEDMFTKIDQSDSIAGIVLVNSGCSFTDSGCSKLIELCKQKGILTLWDDPDHVPGQAFQLHKFSELPDLVILGEPLTNYEIPFSLFSMTEQAHQPWASSQTCMHHSATYAGNKLAVIKATESLFNKVGFLTEDNRIKEVCEKIINSREETIKYFARYINPGMLKLYSTIGYDFIGKKGKDSWLYIEDSDGEKKVLDAVSGGGAVVTGHCQDDIYENVLENHEQNREYWNELSEKLSSVFGFEHVLPAVSGATAVEIAIILALSAANQKKRIIVFKGNFAGNTLISLIGTTNQESHRVFHPIYKNLTCIDPCVPDAEKHLISELEKGDVALVWLEVLQGATEKEIPDNILKVIQDNKEKYGYYLGVDEILMGFYRINKLTSYQDTPLKPDIITFSKALSDGTFPMAAVLVSAEVYQNASSKNAKIVSIYENMYKNQFGAHIGLNCIEKLLDPLNIEKIKRTSKILNEGLQQIQKSTPFLEAVYGKGHIYRLCYKNDLLKIYFNKRAVQQENLFLYLDRIIPALTMSEEDTRELLKRLEKLYSGVGNLFVFKIKSIFISINILRKLMF